MADDTKSDLMKALEERLWLERYERQQRIIYPERYASTSKYIPHSSVREKSRNLKHLGKQAGKSSAQSHEPRPSRRAEIQDPLAPDDTARRLTARPGPIR